MEIIIIVAVVFFIWYLIGICSMVYYMTENNDLMFDDLDFVLTRGLGGLISLIVVIEILLQEKYKNKVLFKKRKS